MDVSISETRAEYQDLKYPRVEHVWFHFESVQSNFLELVIFDQFQNTVGDSLSIPLRRLLEVES